MYGLEIYHRVRRAVLRDGMSERAAAIAFGVDRGTVSKMTAFSEPPGYRLAAGRPRSRMDEHADFVDRIPIDDQDAPKKQRHTIQRIFERLRDERKFAGGYTTVRDYVRPRRQHLKEAFVPLTHPAGHAQADFGEATVILSGVEQKVRFFVMSLPQSDAVFVRLDRYRLLAPYTLQQRHGDPRTPVGRLSFILHGPEVDNSLTINRMRHHQRRIVIQERRQQ